MEPRDADLVRRFQRGDASAGETLFRKHTSTTLSLVTAFVGRVQDADDLVQEVFLEAQRSVAHLRNPASFASWVYKITQRVCSRWLRDQRKAPAGLESPEEVVDETPTDKQRELNRVRAAVDGMPAPLREVLHLRYFDQHSYEQMGEVLGISASAVNARLIKAKRLLRTRLGHVGGSDGSDRDPNESRRIESGQRGQGT